MPTCFCGSCGAGIRLNSFATFFSPGTSHHQRVLIQPMSIRVIEMRSILNIVILLLLTAAAVSGQSQQPQPTAQTSPAGEDAPTLMRHLPDWERVASEATYVVTLDALKRVVPNQPILDSVSFEGGTEAVAANYNQGQLVVVEFSTPQFSVDNDQRIAAKIQELKGQAQPAPTAYRRVGNYSVFVFNGADEAAANQLIDQVQYQKVVQWLGEDPHLYEKLQRYFAQTSASVIIAVLESSGLALVACLGAGALLGFLLFRRRRAQASALYSDAGGSVRLNLDELTDREDTARLLEAPKRQPTN